MKKTLFLIFILLLSVYSFAQNTPTIDQDFDNRIQFELARLEKLDKANPDSSEWSLTLINLANAYKNKGEYLNAAYYGNKGLVMAETINDQFLIAGGLSAMGNIFKKQGNYTKSLELLSKALDQAETIQDNYALGQSTNNLGLLYEDMGELDKAEEMHTKSLQIRQVHTKSKVNSSLLNLGTVSLRKGNYEQSIDYFKKVLSKPKLRNRLKIIATHHMGAAQIAKRQYNTGIDYLKKGLQLATKAGMKEYELLNAEELSRAYEMLGRYDQSLLYFRKYMDIKDQVYDANATIQIAELQNIYENEKKEKALAEQEAQLREKELVISAQNANQKTLWVLVVSLVIVFVSVFVYLKNKKLIKEKLMHETFAQQLIDSQEGERKRIAGELHDSVGQNLLIIKNQLSLLISGKPGDSNNRMSLLTDTASQTIEDIRAISYDLRPYQIDRLGLKTALESMIDRVSESTELSVDYVIGEINGIYSDSNEINFYRIVQECFNNIVKHAGAKKVSLSIMKNETCVTLNISDDGQGFDVENMAGHGFGLIGLKERSRILNGKFEIKSHPGKGTQVEILFDLIAKRQTA